MNELIVISDSCGRCGAALLESDDFCSKCGLVADVDAYPNVPAEVLDSPTELAVVRPGQGAVAPASQLSPLAGVLENRLLVIAILACAGPMGLPALWFSHRFSRGTKIVTTIVYLFVTAILPLAVAWYFLEVAVRPVVDVLGG